MMALFLTTVLAVIYLVVALYLVVTVFSKFDKNISTVEVLARLIPAVAILVKILKYQILRC